MTRILRQTVLLFCCRGVIWHQCSMTSEDGGRATPPPPEYLLRGTQPLAGNPATSDATAAEYPRHPLATRLGGTVFCRMSSAPYTKIKSFDSLVAILLLLFNCHSGSSPSPSLHHAIWPASVFFGPPLPEDQPAGTRTSPTMTKTNIIIS